jgi:hypothetical protein
MTICTLTTSSSDFLLVNLICLPHMSYQWSFSYQNDSSLSETLWCWMWSQWIGSKAANGSCVWNSSRDISNTTCWPRHYWHPGTQWLATVSWILYEQKVIRIWQDKSHMYETQLFWSVTNRPLVEYTDLWSHSNIQHIRLCSLIAHIM